MKRIKWRNLFCRRSLLIYTFATGGDNKKPVPSCWIHVLPPRRVFLPDYCERDDYEQQSVGEWISHFCYIFVWFSVICSYWQWVMAPHVFSWQSSSLLRLPGKTCKVLHHMTFNVVTVTSLSPEEEVSPFEMDIWILTADRKVESVSNSVTVTFHLQIFEVM